MNPIRSTRAGALLRSRWSPLSIPTVLLLAGLVLRLVGARPGWATLLIVGGLIGGALTAYTVVYGSHDRTLDLASIRAHDDAKF
jgi:hypothetical protein